MRFRVSDRSQIPPAQGDAQKLIENLSADYEKFYTLQENMLRGPRHPLERLARRAVRALDGLLARIMGLSFARAAAAVFLIAAVGLALFCVCQAIPKGRPAETEYTFSAAVSDVAPVVRTLDERAFINRATKEALAAVPGIGETLAERIVAERDKNGPFAFLEDILLTPGIGKMKLKAIEEYIRSFAP